MRHTNRFGDDDLDMLGQSCKVAEIEYLKFKFFSFTPSLKTINRLVVRKYCTKIDDEVGVVNRGIMWK